MYWYPKKAAEVYRDYPDGRLRQRLRLGLVNADAVPPSTLSGVASRQTPGVPRRRKPRMDV